MKSLHFYTENFRFLAFGLVLCFFSSFGQTYFIGVYASTIRAAFDLSNSEFGNWYLLITLGSAFGLNRLGLLMDKIALPRWVLILSLAISSAMLVVTLSSGFAAILVGLLGVRMVGQGLLTVTAMTAMTRYFDVGRGRAVAVASLGMPIGQAILPALAVFLIGAVGWQQSWGIFTLVFCLVGVPLLMWLLKGQKQRHNTHLQKAQAEMDSGIKHLKRSDMLKDYKFYLVLPALVLCPFWITAMFFFAEDLTLAKGWSMSAWTGLYWIYALGAIVMPLIAGNLVDRFSGKKIIPFFPPLLMMAFILVILSNNIIGGMGFLFFIGAGIGLSIPVTNALWAELYGTAYLGEIKSLSASIMIVSTALAPAILGHALDAGFSILALTPYAIIHALIAIACLIPIFSHKNNT